MKRKYDNIMNREITTRINQEIYLLGKRSCGPKYCDKINTFNKNMIKQRYRSTIVVDYFIL